MTALNMTISEREDSLHCVVSGDWATTEIALDAFLPLFTKCRETEKTRIFIDSRSMIGQLSGEQKIEYIDTLIQSHEVYLKFGGEPMKIAICTSSARVESGHPGVKVAADSGFPFYYTDDMEAAEKWLQEECSLAV